jgi:ribosomal protein S18 acetylase RimI-like enzyme
MYVEATTDPEQMPAPAAVARLYETAATAAPLTTDPSVARGHATLYGWARVLPGTAAASLHDGEEMVGFGFGYSWDWGLMNDAWSVGLRAKLGRTSGLLDRSFSLVLLTVAPNARGRGLGRGLLDALLSQVDEPVAWLLTADADSPARRLYEGAGWTPVGPGPDAPDGRPGLVLARHRCEVRAAG